MPAPGSLESLRQRNLGVVLDAVQRREATSRADLVRTTGLSRTAVSSLVGQLVRDGLLVERGRDEVRAGGGEDGPHSGRPPTRLVLNPRAGAVLGVHLGHDVIRLALADLAGEVLLEDETELDVDHRPEAALDHVTAVAAGLVQRSGVPRDRLLGVGVAVSSPVPTSADDRPSLLADWQDVDVAAVLGARLDLPVHVGNDANLGAMAERSFGAARRSRDVVYVMLATGIGTGLVLGGHLHTGATGTAGELGHVVVEPGGRVCRCGNRGCLETVAGGHVLVAALPAGPGGRPATLADLLRGCAAGEPRAVGLVQDAGRAVGTALAAACTLLDPELVVVGGSTAQAGEVLLAPLRESLFAALRPGSDRRTSVVRGRLGARAEVLGAVELATAHAPRPAVGRVDLAG